jgi:hypothetical protein
MGLKRYLAHYGATHHPHGGMGDFVGDFDTLAEAIATVCKREEEERKGHEQLYSTLPPPWTLDMGRWATVWDSDTGEAVWDEGQTLEPGLVS